MRQIFLILGGIIIAASAVVGWFTFNQIHEARLTLSADLQYRTRLLVDSLKESVEPYYIGKSEASLRKLINKFADREHLVGLAVYDNKGNAIATSTGFSPYILQNTPIIGAVMDTDKPAGVFTSVGENNVYIFAEPLHDEGRVVGTFMVAQSAGYIEEEINQIWKNNLLRLLIQVIIFSLAIILLVRSVIFKPLNKLVESIKSARANKTSRFVLPRHSFFNPLMSEIAKVTHSLKQARFAASEEARLRLQKLDTPWTAERLREFIKAYVKDRPIFLLSNREPYVHEKTGNKIHHLVPASGMVTALEPVMEACGGTWIAYGSGSADRETVDRENKIAVPPDEPKYTLKRIWLTEREVQGYYTGFSNEALWPLCLLAHTRPTFRKEDWTEYRRVNGKFAETLLSEIKNMHSPVILIQDFHLALVPQMIKAGRPDVQIGLFWHIPWPSAEHFSICPWRTEILEGMLGSDIIGFHTQQHCNNFLDTVGKSVESLIDFEQFSITREDRKTFVKPFPISIDFTDSNPAPELKSGRSALKKLNIKTPWVGLGVDRLDYTKGILERFKGLELFFEGHKEYIGQLTFLQIAPISREGSATYREYGEAVTTEAGRINQKFQANGWQPIVLEKRHYSHEELLPLYRLANFCLITSLHDGMNLVAKEFVAARDDESGVLILSNFTGASRDLKGALIVNPYSAEETAEAIHTALILSQAEKRRRMKVMRESVKDYNVYRWSAEFIKAIIGLG